MAFEFKLPDIGEGVVEGEIVAWMVKRGDVVAEDQPLLEIMTDKATVEIPSPRAGKVLETRGKEGATVPVGSVLVVIETEGPTGEGKDEAPAGGKAPSGAPVAQTPVAQTPVAQTPVAPAPVAPGAEAGPLPASPVPSRTRVLAAPAVRKLARERGIDLARVPPSGPRGRVTRQDVLGFGGPGGAARAGAAASPDERVAYRGLRRKIADAMTESKTNIPHFTYVEEVDVTELRRFRERSRGEGERHGVKLTYLPYIIKGLIRGFRKFPYLNARLDLERSEIVLRRTYNIGIAAATPQGLIVPVVKGCEGRTLLEIAREIDRVVADAREGKSRLEDLQDGTFTITNLGPLGGILATPIIHFPEVAILGVHKIRTVPRYADGAWVPRDVMNLSLSLDHRVIDGAVGAEFLQYVIRYLENPWLLLVESI